jgi:ATP-dependent Clp protease ATP-binding subunit ClpA
VIDEEAVSDAVEKTFTPEFRNRLDAVVQFTPLSKTIMRSIVEKELTAFKRQLEEKNITLEVSAVCLEQLSVDGYSREFGARNVGRIIEERIKSFFVDEVLFGRWVDGGKARADFSGGEYRIEVIESFERAFAEEDDEAACEAVEEFAVQ